MNRPTRERTVQASPPHFHVAQSALRCPYCHDDVDARGTAWTACRACLARHHAACWNESRRCASCGGEGALVEAGTSAGTTGSALAVARLARELNDIDWQLAAARGSRWSVFDFLTRAVRGVLEAGALVVCGVLWYRLWPALRPPEWFVNVGLVVAGTGVLRFVLALHFAWRAARAQGRMEEALLRRVRR